MASSQVQRQNHDIEIIVLDKFMKQIVKTVKLETILQPLQGAKVLLEHEYESLLICHDKTETFIQLLKEKDWKKLSKFREVLRLNGYKDLARVMDDEVKEIKSRKGKLPSAKTDNQVHVPDSIETTSDDASPFKLQTSEAIYNLTQRMNNLEKGCEDSNTKIKALEDALAIKQKEYDAMVASNNQLREKISHMNTHLEEKEKELESTRERLVEKEQELATPKSLLEKEELATSRSILLNEEQEKLVTIMSDSNLEDKQKEIEILNSEISQLKQKQVSANSAICLIQ